MHPFTLSTERLILDQPKVTDIVHIAEYCSNPLFQRFMVIPWPYTHADAEYFVNDAVPAGWQRGSDWTWAIRTEQGGDLLGSVGVRLQTGMVGYWLGAPHHGQGILPEALTAVVQSVFERTSLEKVLWECVVGNTASMRVAQKVGFHYTGCRNGIVLARDGSPQLSWTAEISRERLLEHRKQPRQVSEWPDWPLPSDGVQGTL